MTGDINVNITITADAVQAFFSLLGLVKESREESTEEESKEESVNLVVNTTTSTALESNNNINNNHYDDVVVANKYSSNNRLDKLSNDSTDIVYPPTKEDITDYVLEKGYTLDVNRFYLYYSRLGWCNKNGVSIIRTWKETIDYWMTNNVSNTGVALQPVDKNNREALKATRQFIPTEF